MPSRCAHSAVAPARSGASSSHLRKVETDSRRNHSAQYAKNSAPARSSGSARRPAFASSRRIRGVHASADNFAKAAAATSTIHLFDGRAAPPAGCDLNPEGGPQPSGAGNVLHSPPAALRKRHAHWRGASLGLARRGSDRADHHRPRREVLQNASRADRTKAQPGADCAYRTPSSSPIAARGGIPLIHHARRPAVAVCAGHLLVPASPPRRRNQLPCRRTSASTAARYPPHGRRAPGDCLAPLRPRRATATPATGTYLGHIDIRSTQRYLQMTPDLLEAASQRFAQYAMGIDHEG
jgi:hypothetical protein